MFSKLFIYLNLFYFAVKVKQDVEHGKIKTEEEQVLIISNLIWHQVTISVSVVEAVCHCGSRIERQA